MPIVRCNKCNNDYEFKEPWFKKNDPSEFICRKCKITIKTQTITYRKQQERKSKKILSNPDIKNKMSQMAILNNTKNAKKISKSIKDYFSDHKNRQRARNTSQKKWKDPQYRKMVHEGLKRKWQDPQYRGKILGSRVHLKKQNNKLKSVLIKNNLKFTLEYIIATYEFDALIEDKFLYDEQLLTEKRLFIDHYFSDLIYTDDINLIIQEGQKH